MCADSRCLTILDKKSTADTTGLPNTGPSDATVQVASGHINSAINNTIVPLNLGPHDKASVLENDKLMDSLCSIAPMADAGFISIFHPGDKGFTSYQRKDVKITFSGPPVVEGYRETTPT